MIEQENVVGYDSKGNPIFESQYLKEIGAILADIDNKTAELISNEEIKKNIIDANNLAQ